MFSVEALRAAVAAHESIETIQELFEGGRVPKDVRAEFWKVSGKNGHTFIFSEISYEAYIWPRLLRLQDEHHNFNPYTLELGVSECIATTRRPGHLEWATGLREPVYHPQSVLGASW